MKSRSKIHFPVLPAFQHIQFFPDILHEDFVQRKCDCRFPIHFDSVKIIFVDEGYHEIHKFSPECGILYPFPESFAGKRQQDFSLARTCLGNQFPDHVHTLIFPEGMVGHQIPDNFFAGL
ncbi:unknown [Phocaeicola coprophilus CAG:333]|nr:unknown [Phocaeicola coprophilus CAG:333]